MRATAMALIVAALAGCGGGESSCPVVTPENVHLMTGNLPPGNPCTQDYIQPREQVTFCALPVDQAGPPACQIAAHRAPDQP